MAQKNENYGLSLQKIEASASVLRISELPAFYIACPFDLCNCAKECRLIRSKTNLSVAQPSSEKENSIQPWGLVKVTTHSTQHFHVSLKTVVEENEWISIGAC